MAIEDNSGYIRYSIDNSRITKKDSMDIDLSTLKDFEAQVRYITKALQSATNEVVHVTKTIDSVTGLAKASFDVKQDKSNIASAVMKSTTADLQGKYGYEPNFASTIKQQELHTLTYHKTMTGKKAQSLAQDTLENLGGSAELAPTHKNKDRMKLTYRVPEAEYRNQVEALGGEARANAYFKKQLEAQLKEASSISSFENKDKQIKAEEAEKKKVESRNRAESRKQQETAEAKSKKAQEGVAGGKGGKSFPIHWIQIVIGVLTGIADLTRRLLVAALERGSIIKEQAVDARSVGTSQGALRMYESQERAMGMRKGVYLSALKDIQSNFGDVSNLNESSVKELAKVLGTETEEAIKMGLGQNNPEGFMQTVLDAYFERGEQGINSLGQYVGKEQAQRELATALDKAGMGNLAEILRTMFYTNSQGIFAGALSGTSSASAAFMNLVSHDDFGVTDIQRNKAAELGQIIDILKDRFTNLKNAISEKFLLKLGTFIEKIESITSGTDPVANIENATDAIKANRAANQRLSEKALLAKGAYTQAFKAAGLSFDSPELKELGITDAESFFNFLVGASVTNQDLPITGVKGENYAALMNFLTTKEGKEALQSYIIQRTAQDLANQAHKDELKSIKESKPYYSKGAYTDTNLQYIIERTYEDAGKKHWEESEYEGAYVAHAVYSWQNLVNRGAFGLGFDAQEMRDAYSYVLGGKDITYATLREAKVGTKELDKKIAEKLKSSGFEKLKKANGKENESDSDFIQRALASNAITEDEIFEIMFSNLSADYSGGWGISKKMFNNLSAYLNKQWAETHGLDAAVDLALYQGAATNMVKDFVSKYGASTITVNNAGMTNGTFVLKIEDAKGHSTSMELTSGTVAGKNISGSATVDAEGNLSNVTTNGLEKTDTN